MAKDKIHVAEKGRNEDAAVMSPPTNQVDDTAMTYVDDGNGNIIAGPGVGIPAQAQQPAVTPTVTATQPAETVVQNAGEQPAVEQPADEITARPQRDYGSQPASRNAVMDAQMQKIADVESGKAQPQQFEFNWDSGISFADVVRSSDRPKRAVLDDYMAWSRATGNPINWYEVSQVIGDTNVDNNFHQDEVDEKKAERKAKWDALGTFLTHLGNAVGAAGWGGSVKLHDPVEMSNRQRQLQEATLARRRAYNKDLMNLYMNQDRNYWLNQKNLGQAGLIQQKIDDAKREQARKDAKNEADIARTQSATNLTNEKTETEKTMRPVKVQTEQAKQKKLTTPTVKGRPSSRRSSKGSTNHEEIWANNKSRYPEYTKKFMEENNIHGYDKKNWTQSLIKQYNAEVKAMEGKGNSAGKPTRTKVNY